jgi:hypothetical protein
MGGVKDSGRGRTGPDSLADFSDVIWINARSGQREYPFSPSARRQLPKLEVKSRAQLARRVS